MRMTFQRPVRRCRSVCRKYSRCSSTCRICGISCSSSTVGFSTSSSAAAPALAGSPPALSAAGPRPKRRLHAKDVSSVGLLCCGRRRCVGLSSGPISHLSRSHRAALTWWFRQGLQKVCRCSSRRWAQRQQFTLMRAATSLNFWYPAWLKFCIARPKEFRSLPEVAAEPPCRSTLDTAATSSSYLARSSPCSFFRAASAGSR
mmetsp:Transcript_7613/g.22319  ORF Transcript_7613/g.22319 Transcript_7613/m.22319 type:complete len:202 (+) Transcript_7613:1175-1780(+)